MKNQQPCTQLGENMDSVGRGGSLQLLCVLQTHAFSESSDCYNTRHNVSSGSETKVMWEIWGPFLALQHSRMTLKQNS